MLDRRSFILSVGTAALTNTSIAEAAPSATADTVAAPASGAPEALLTLTPKEAALLTALVDRLIPADDLSPSASQCGVVTYIDRQLAGAFGAGARLYLEGPFRPNAPAVFGYQSAMTPLQLVQAGAAELDDWSTAQRGKPIAALPAAELDPVLKDLEAGKITLGRVKATAFFEMLLQLTMEGFFADPIYGGNRDKAAWRMIGYPGLPATYAKAIRTHRGKRYEAEPKSIADFA
ncbi:gluconate 2-dehydrogenase subunit 3 family protein [Methyloraptor flagellatus]|uniref:Gluconate 2-dehydrogenase subunit 3 family protein n=1 Tax=Methyloraptor flagellatus TaxID=3162530 RepID=A0AAU7XD71_9HYPH